MGTDRETDIQTRTLVAIFRTSIHPTSGSRGPGTAVIFYRKRDTGYPVTKTTNSSYH